MLTVQGPTWRREAWSQDQDIKATLKIKRDTAHIDQSSGVEDVGNKMHMHGSFPKRAVPARKVFLRRVNGPWSPAFYHDHFKKHVV